MDNNYHQTIGQYLLVYCACREFISITNQLIVGTEQKEMERVSVMVLLVTGVANGCGPCIKSECVPPNGCLAGMVTDWCNCCYKCGQREGEKCDHPNITANVHEFGRCGEGLICQVRVDLPAGDPEEALCVCQHTSKLCGSDGVTYENQCQLTEERYRKRNGLKAVSRGPCRFAPKITTLPTDIPIVIGSQAALYCEAIGWPLPNIEWKKESGNIFNDLPLFFFNLAPKITTLPTDIPIVIGSQAALYCEAIGWPLPNIEWKKESGNIFNDLPGDNTHIAMHTRNGKYEVSSWLQFIQTKSTDVGTYWCRATNDEGEAEASAQLYILPEFYG
ncbi:insulin-like growth factor-binding protein-related protein 1 [Centruroides sculpturatus]|uniref:insulin-like growth factor-binding protein-related protein 1 n=1 Tax=Centruroides sculpturatus TaxID=218467 RepID=UPI000C6DF7C6|nr:insulin-like growth factor-binding protein-related protein 1 [Centruroides sculpturatus]